MICPFDSGWLLPLWLLYLSGAPQLTQVEAQSIKNVFCHQQQFQSGDIINAKANGNQKPYCGQNVGWFLAVQTDKLFHLQCASSNGSPIEATVKIFDMTNDNTRSNVFNNEIKCDIRRNSVTTGNKAYLIANRLAENRVPYNVKTCNAQHYVEYLANGQTKKKPGDFCPLFLQLTPNTNVNDPNFRLAGAKGTFNWPQRGSRGILTRSNSKNRSFSWRPYSANPGRSPPRSGVKMQTSRRHSHGGHAGGEGGGSRGVGSGTVTPGTASGGASGVGATTAGGTWGNGGGGDENEQTGRRRSSAATRSKPFWGMLSYSRRG